VTSEVLTNDCRAAMAAMAEASADAIVTDPPYGLSFMGKDWDRAVPGPDYWREALRVAKPGAHLLAFGGTRVWHRLAVAIEDAGWEVRDTIMWLHGQGFPKSLDVSKAIDKEAGAEREVTGPNPHARPSDGERFNAMGTKTHSPLTAPATPRWSGFGTALKPAWEPVIVARKPLAGTVAANVLEYGTGGINVDGCRIEGAPPSVPQPNFRSVNGRATKLDANGRNGEMSHAIGRWPANLVLDEEAAAALDEMSGTTRSRDGGVAGWQKGGYVGGRYEPIARTGHNDSGGASRFFYCAKASKAERNLGGVDNRHPTVKPLALMRWLVRLVTPPGGLVLDPFCGSGTTGIAATMEGFRFIGIEMDETHAHVARQRIAAAAEKAKAA
jgi:hypothetical protein